ncbi:MAG: hypothetical protein HXX13_04780, partial [Bacteroidetes bacterium]|nr:hypothetical protein [Bacteroidota bacterium]
ESKLLDEKGSPVESWDGTNKGSPAQQDVYIWRVQAVYRDGSIWNNTDIGEHQFLTEQVWGTITLIR